MTDRCEWCNHKAPGHDALCQHATSADRLRGVRLPGHEEVQHRAAFGDVCGPFSPGDPCDACGTVHHFGECPTNYVHVHTGPGAAVRALADMIAFGTGAHLTTDPQARKDVPLATGLLDYFPDALAAVAATSLQGSRQHHPDEPLHWDKNKSTDHADCLLRHLVDRGKLDTDGISHTAKVAWRALALLQTEIETMREEKAA